MTRPDSRARLLELATASGVSLARLSELIGRNQTYLQQFIRKGSPRKLEEGDRRTLARFFGIDEAELGAPEDISFAPMPAKRGEWVDVPRSRSALRGTGACCRQRNCPSAPSGFQITDCP